MDTWQAALSHRAWDTLLPLKTNQMYLTWRRGSCLHLLFSPSRENVFGKRLVAMEAFLSTTSVVEGWKTFNHFKSPDLLSIPKFIIMRMRKWQTRWFQKTMPPLLFAHKWTGEHSNWGLHHRGSFWHTFLSKALPVNDGILENERRFWDCSDSTQFLSLLCT